jgi:hypothetical protein
MVRQGVGTDSADSVRRGMSRACEDGKEPS